MNESRIFNPPALLPKILARTEKIKFGMASDELTGSLLRTLAASKPASNLLELGTGTGVATAWLLDGMDRESRLTSVENDEAVLSIAREILGSDDRVTFIHADGEDWLSREEAALFDLIFADSWPGKYNHLEEALGLLKPAGLYVIDDMLPQPNWPDGHASRVLELIAALENRNDLIITKLKWSTGLMIAARRPDNIK